MATRRALILGLLAPVLLLALAAGPAVQHLRAASVLLKLTGQDDPSGLTRWVTMPVEEREGELTLPHRRLRYRGYRPRDMPGAPVALLLHGVHPRGIDEPRLRAFARALSSAGLDVMTPELPELAGYEIVPSTLDDIRACARAAGEPSGRAVGVFGISFAGGLAMIAAAQDPAPFRYLVTVGAHHSLERLAAFYAGRPVRGPAGRSAPGTAHPYGARVIAYAHAGQFFDEPDLPIAREAIRLHLAEHYRDARTRIGQLSDSGRARMELVLDDKHRHELGDLLLDAVAKNREALAAVSPAGQLAGLRTPTFLIHGAEDPVIPSIETRWLATEVPPSALRTALVTPMLGHADLSKAIPIQDHWRVVHFMADVLSEAR